MTPPEDEMAAKNYIQLLQQRKFDLLAEETNPSLSKDLTPDLLEKMAAQFPSQEPTSIKVVGVRIAPDPQVPTTSITLEYEFPQKWLLVNVVTQRREEVAPIVGIHLNPLPDSLENLNRFTLAGKSAPQRAVLLLAILTFLFSLYAFVICIQAKIQKRKWFWLILTLFGVGKLAISWTTGQIFFNLLWFQVPPAGASAQLYSPWIIFVSFPLGAITFLALRRKLSSPSAVSDPLPHP